MNKAVLFTILVFSIFVACNKVKKMDSPYVVSFFQKAALLAQDSENNIIIDLLPLVPDGANQVGFFPPYELGLFDNDKRNPSLTKLSKLSQSRHLDQFWCLAFFKDDQLISFVDLPRAEIDLQLSIDSSSNVILFLSEVKCKIINVDPKIILDVSNN